MNKVNFSVLSSDGQHSLAGVVYLPEEKPIGLLHIVHGMTEHIGRYDKFMGDIAKLGYICFGFDNLGHGNTASDSSELGFIAESGGHELLAKDVKLFSDAVIKEFSEGENALPYFLLGHSMGSFIARLAAAEHIRPERLIIMGSGGKNPAASAGLAMVAIIKRLFGPRHISPLLDKLAFGSYNIRFSEASESDPSPWLTRDKAQREKYYADPFCTFKFTASAMGDLIRLTKITNSASWYKKLPKDMPVLLVSGENDPVGDYGRDVRQVEALLLKQGIPARCILYPDARHEILNDSTYLEVKKDIIDFLRL